MRIYTCGALYSFDHQWIIADLSVRLSAYFYFPSISTVIVGILMKKSTISYEAMSKVSIVDKLAIYYLKIIKMMSKRFMRLYSYFYIHIFFNFLCYFI